eukprot:TRINITY_DN3031_c1_g1_i1.p3 TRINITY_DN3031_c1_g1~~TRINITY_DN3031_c1_g1_i1.p3  ORF type:complete len:271 (+),score=78.42 TRINITY_DN3031_c1_g1_i1:373-1185(+)
MLGIEAMGLKRAAKQEPVDKDSKAPKTNASAAGKAAPATPSTAATPPPPGGGGGAPTPNRKKQDLDKGIMLQLAKLTLNNTRNLAAVSSAVITTIVFNRDEGAGKELHDELKEVAAAYTTTVRALQAEQKAEYAAPHTYVWQGLITIVYRNTQEGQDEYSKHMSNTMKVLSDSYVAKAMEITDSQDKEVYIKQLPHVIGANMKICRVSKCWNAKMAKIELSATPASETEKAMVAVVKYIVEKCQGKVKMGAAPRSDAERRIQAWIESTHG